MTDDVEALAESVFGVYGNDEYRLAERLLASPWLAAHVAAARAEAWEAALAPIASRLDHWESQIGEWYDHEDGPSPECREGYDRGVTHLIAALRDLLPATREGA